MQTMEQALPHSEKLHTVLVHSLGGIVWEADGRTFQFTFVSPQAERILGYPVEQWVSEPDFWRRHTHPDDVAWCSDLCWDATSRGRDHQFEYRMIAADGRTVWLHDIVTVHREPTGEIRLRGIMLDITEQRQLQAQYLQAQKLEAVGHLAGGIAHDFNNVLSVIQGYSEVLLSGTEPADPRYGQLQEVRRAAEHGQSLTRQLLHFSRKQVLEPRPLELNEIVRDMERLLARLIGEDVTFTLRLAPDLGRAIADAGQVEQILMNLVVNARDAMPDGGRLVVETTNAALDAGQAQRGRLGAGPGDYVRLSVQDTGTGIDTGLLDRMFEPFVTTKDQEAGSGLGLATVYRIVEQCGGEIMVDSVRGAGSRFEIYLPRAAASADAGTGGAGATAPAPPSAREPEPGSGTVLLVEDEAALRKLLRSALETKGYTVLDAASGEDAVALSMQHAGQIDVLLTDVVMPGMNGRELAERVRRQRPETRVLYMSGYTDDAVLLRGLSSRAEEFIQKPFTPSVLLGKLAQVLTA